VEKRSVTAAAARDSGRPAKNTEGKENTMDAKTLIQITTTRLACCGSNTTEQTYFAAVLEALRELDLRRTLDTGYKPEH
jgi:hypothetical protein